jgi:HJR/Mrr/RecB family endonuclease
MARRRRDDEEEGSIWGFIGGVFMLYLLYIAFLYNSNRAAYWQQVWYFAAFVVIVAAGIIAWQVLIHRWREKRLNDLLAAVKQDGLEEYVKNFIDRFGMQKGKKTDWTFRGHTFDWQRLEDFRKILNEKGMHLSTDKWDATLIVLKHYIQEKEERLTRESVSVLPQKFSTLSGSDFENLLYRLFTAMSYAVQKTGKIGDQGGDLIANLNGQRIVIQAKCYSNTVGNAAVQEAVAAQKFYDCNKVMVVTNSSFTQEAIELAKVNNVELVGGGKLSELLLQNLKENWGN